MHRPLSRRSLFALGALSATSRAAPPLEVVYSRLAERPTEGYGYRLLELALARCGEPFRLRLSAHTMSAERGRLELSRGGVSVQDFGSSPDLESRFLPVYFPIDLGLSGYRRLIVHTDQAARLGALRDRAALKGLVAGQGLGWADTRVLEHAGLRVETAQFESLFRMLEAGRFTLLPLGIEEAAGLLARHRAEAPSAILLPAPLLHYRFARLFFVSPKQPHLRDALLRGLQAAFADGSLQQLLAKDPAFAPLLAQGRSALGPVIELDNPWLSPPFLAMPQAWFWPLAKRQ